MMQNADDRLINRNYYDYWPAFTVTVIKASWIISLISSQQPYEVNTVTLCYFIDEDTGV